jgi:hypothetical protein
LFFPVPPVQWLKKIQTTEQEEQEGTGKKRERREKSGFNGGAVGEL